MADFWQDQHWGVRLVAVALACIGLTSLQLQGGSHDGMALPGYTALGLLVLVAGFAVLPRWAWPLLVGLVCVGAGAALFTVFNPPTLQLTPRTLAKHKLSAGVTDICDGAISCHVCLRVQRGDVEPAGYERSYPHTKNVLSTFYLVGSQQSWLLVELPERAGKRTLPRAADVASDTWCGMLSDETPDFYTTINNARNRHVRRLLFKVSKIDH